MKRLKQRLMYYLKGSSINDVQNFGVDTFILKCDNSDKGEGAINDKTGVYFDNSKKSCKR